MKRWIELRRGDSARAARTVCPASIEPLEGRRMFAGGVLPEALDEMAGRAAAGVEVLPQTVVALPETARPSVRSTQPPAGAKDVDTDISIVVYVNLPNEGGVTNDPAILAANVRLFRAADGAPVPANVNTTAAGDAITLRPLSPLQAFTEYRFDIYAGLVDDTGAPFHPFTMTFTTGAAKSAPPRDIAFAKVPLPTATGNRFTGVTIGPDNRLYAGTMDGEILRFDILPDGTLATATVINTIRAQHNGARRIITGIRFDAAGTADNLSLWVTHGDGAESAAPDWTGTVSRLTGRDLTTCNDIVRELPRSVRDHLTQQMDFGPDGALYVSQGSNNAMGAPDNAWGQRPERLLSAAILRIDTAALLARVTAGQGPLSVRTEAGGTYDPYAPGAPVTLYATGVRNAFDILWHSNGHLYAPTNGSAPGGNAPAGPGVPGITNNPDNEPDWLFDIHPGRYYGHPNPLRSEYVLNGGNPTAAHDLYEVRSYPVGTQPDPNWHPALLNLGNNRSPTGTIEYQSDTFGGALKGSLLMCEYSVGDDLVAVRLGADGTVATADDPDNPNDDPVTRGMGGTTGFDNPVDLVEHVGPGHLYVVEHGDANRITLLRPAEGPTQSAAPVRQGRIVFNDPVGGPASPRRKVTLTNPTAAALSVAGVGLVGRDKGMFRIVDPPTLPLTLPAGGRVQLTVEFDPPLAAAPGLHTAALRLTPADRATPAIDVALRALATAGEGGVSEPSLQRVFDLFELDVDAGDPDPATSEMPIPGAGTSDVIDAQTLVKAGDGPVTVDVLSVFASAGSPTIRFGHYDPAAGEASLTEVLTVTESQRTKPPLTSGGTTFDPGSSPFGLYTTAPRFGTTAYTQDSRNTFEPVEANRRKALVYPLPAWDGVPLENTYVIAFEEVAGGYDFQDFVAVIRNVRPADGGVIVERRDDASPAQPELTVLLDGVELSANAPVDFGQAVQGAARPERTLMLRNAGDADLSISAITLPAGFELVTPFAAATLSPAASVTLRVAMSTAAAGAPSGTLALATNDADEAAFAFALSGTVTEPLPPLPAEPAVVADPISVVRRRTRLLVKLTLHNTLAEKFTGRVTFTVTRPSDSPGFVPTTFDAAETRTLKLRPRATRVVTLSLPMSPSTPSGPLTVTLTVAGITRTYPAGPNVLEAREKPRV